MLLRSSRLLGLGLVFLEDCLDRSIALGGAFSVEAHAGDAKRLGIGIPSNLGSALALPANELIAFLGGNSGDIILLVANLILVAIEDNGACTVIGERTLVRVNGEGHVEVLLRSSIDIRCKRCKRYAHDNHEHGRQQSQQTSFKSRFLHVISPIH